MDNGNKVFNSMDEVYTNCSWYCLVESNKRRPTKIEKKMDALTLKNPYYHNPHKNISQDFKIFWKSV